MPYPLGHWVTQRCLRAPPGKSPARPAPAPPLASCHVLRARGGPAPPLPPRTPLVTVPTGPAPQRVPAAPPAPQSGSRRRRQPRAPPLEDTRPGLPRCPGDARPLPPSCPFKLPLTGPILAPMLRPVTASSPGSSTLGLLWEPPPAPSGLCDPSRPFCPPHTRLLLPHNLTRSLAAVLPQLPSLPPPLCRFGAVASLTALTACSISHTPSQAPEALPTLSLPSTPIPAPRFHCSRLCTASDGISSCQPSSPSGKQVVCLHFCF